MRVALTPLLCLALAAQDASFQSQSRLVLVPVTVTDAKGRTVDGLEARDFLMLDNGRPQATVVDTFVTGVAPVALAIAVQSSGISAAALAKIRKIGAMIQPLLTGERGCAALLSFDARIRWLQECTSDPEAITRAFERLEPGAPKAGRLLDAAHEAIAKLRAKPNVRRVLLLISESRDRGSESELEAVTRGAQAAGVTIYAATYSAFLTPFAAKAPDHAPPTASRAPDLPRREPESPPGRERIPIPTPENRIDLLGGMGELGRLGKSKTTDVLTARTGGISMSFTRLKGLENAIEKLGAELHSQYLLSFTPQPDAPGFHRIEVRVPGRAGLRIRARPGYWTGASTP